MAPARNQDTTLTWSKGHPFQFPLALPPHEGSRDFNDAAAICEAVPDVGHEQRTNHVEVITMALQSPLYAIPKQRGFSMESAQRPFRRDDRVEDRTPTQSASRSRGRTMLATSAFAQSASEVAGPSSLVPIANEPAPQPPASAHLGQSEIVITRGFQHSNKGVSANFIRYF